MFYIFRKPIYTHIDLYTRYKAKRHPVAAATQKDELLRFVKTTKISSLNDITLERIDSYIYECNGVYLRSVAEKSIRYFIAYCVDMGFISLALAPPTTQGMIHGMTKLHPLVQVDQVERVKKLRRIMIDGKPMTFRAIKEKMGALDKRTYDIHAIYRWYKYDLPDSKLSTGKG